MIEAITVPDEAPEVTKPEGETNDEILAQARKQRSMCEDADGDNRTAAIDDLTFLTGGENQWDAKAVTARKLRGRPIITVNDLPSLLHQVTNDQRQNRPSIKVHPVDDDADPETAKIEQGMIKHIEYDSNADVAYDRSVNSAAAIGFGYWWLDTDFESETSFNQKIMYRSVRNALSVRIDPLSTEPDGSDMQFAFIEALINKDEFKRRWPDANASNEGAFNDGTTDFKGWVTNDAVLVCHYFCIKKVPEAVVLLSTGESGFKRDLVPEGMGLPPGIEVVKERMGERCKVMRYLITGVDVLKSTEVKCKWIPVFPVYGDEIDIEGKVIRSGIIRNAKGPAQSYNVMITSATEEVALRSKSPYMMAEGQEEGHEDEFASANNEALPYITYKPVALGGILVPPPQRQPMADIPNGMLAMAMHAQDNKKKTTGLFDASIGARGSATSGKQELAQQREGDMANFHYADGLHRTIRHCGRCLAWMIPHYYDTERVVRILGEDDTASYARINQPNLRGKPNESGQVKNFLNDVTVGQFDITVSAGPSYSTMRQENAEFFANAMASAKDPATAAVVTYLAMKNQDAPGAEEATAMLKKLLPPGLAEPEDGEEPGQVVQTPKGPLPVDQVPAVLQQLEAKLGAMEQALQKAEVDKAEIQKAELMLKQREVEIKAFEAETRRMEAGAKIRTDSVRADLEQVQADAVRAPSLDQIQQLIEQAKPKVPDSLSITGPSGMVYSVQLKKGA